MRKIIGLIIVGFITFSSLFISSVKASDDWSFDYDDNNFKVTTIFETLEYRITILDQENCDNIENSVSFDNTGDWKTMSKDSGNGTYNIPYIKNYNGKKCQTITVRGKVGGSSEYTHKYYARVVTGTGETVAATTPTPTPSPTPTPESKPEKQDDVMPIRESKEKEEDGTPAYGIVILGGVVILGVVIFRLKGKKRKSINY